MRSLSPDDRRYRGAEPDDDPAAAGLGSAWTWLLPHAALAHAAVRGDRAGALDRLGALELLMRDCGLAMLPDRSDGDAPHGPRGSRRHALPIAETLRAWHALTGVRRDLRRRELTAPGAKPRARAAVELVGAASA